MFLAPVPIRGSAGPKPSVVTSQWRDRDVTIDGADGEWERWSEFGPESRFSVALINDDSSLFMALRTGDPAASLQMLRLGLIVWFDAGGGTRKRFGVKYPVGTQSYGVAEEQGRGGPGRGGRGFSRPDRGGGPGDTDSLWSQAEADGRLNRLELVGAKESDRRTLVVGRTAPLDVRIGWREGTVVYELRIPLRASQDAPYAIGATPPKAVGIGLENAERERSPSGFRLGGMPGGSPGGGAPGGATGPPPGGEAGGRGTDDRSGGNAPDRPLKPPAPLNAWVVARLAAKPQD